MANVFEVRVTDLLVNRALMTAMDDDMSIDKKEDMREHSMDSTESSPEAEADAGTSNLENPEQPKRKGGRKPVCYATCLAKMTCLLTD